MGWKNSSKHSGWRHQDGSEGGKDQKPLSTECLQCQVRALAGSYQWEIILSLDSSYWLHLRGTAKHKTSPARGSGSSWIRIGNLFPLLPNTASWVGWTLTCTQGTGGKRWEGGERARDDRVMLLRRREECGARTVTWTHRASKDDESKSDLPDPPDLNSASPISILEAGKEGGNVLTIFENLKGCLVEEEAGLFCFVSSFFSKAPEGRTGATRQKSQVGRKRTYLTIRTAQ